MHTFGHRQVAVATAIAAAHLHPLPITAVIVSVTSAAITGGGWFSPDIDNQPFAKTLDSWLPDEWLGHGGPLGHRRLAHSWMLPAAAWGAWTLWMPPVPIWAWSLAWGAWLGWCSHLVADFVFGQANFRYGRPKGVPLILWWYHVGVGGRSDGPLAHLVAWVAAALAAWWGLGLVQQGLPAQL
jgi:hypothetical protein